jgi:hypothetical protein
MGKGTVSVTVSDVGQDGGGDAKVVPAAGEFFFFSVALGKDG